MYIQHFVSKIIIPLLLFVENFLFENESLFLNLNEEAKLNCKLFDKASPYIQNFILFIFSLFLVISLSLDVDKFYRRFETIKRVKKINLKLVTIPVD